MCDELVMIYDSNEEIENSDDAPEIFEMKAPVKEVSEVITIDSESESEDYQNTNSSPKINLQPDETCKNDDNELHFDDFEIDPNEKRTKLFVNHLPQELTDIEFNTLFMEDGPIKECFIFRDRFTQYSYGYGLIEFEYPDDAARALRQKADMIVQGKKLKVVYSRENNGGGYANLYYQNIEEDVGKEEIHEAFKPFGEILQFKLLPQPGTNGISMGRGFVRYANRFQAVMSMKELDEKKVFRSNVMSVSFAEEHGKQKAEIYYNVVKKANMTKNRRSIKARLGIRNTWNNKRKFGGMKANGQNNWN
jgi:RNA recognition motif-containing protein